MDRMFLAKVFLVGIVIGVIIYLIGFALALDGVNDRKEFDKKRSYGYNITKVIKIDETRSEILQCC